MDNNNENETRAGENDSVLSSGGPPQGEGATSYPNIYNVLFI